MIKDGTIEDILPIESFKSESISQDYLVEDLGNLCIFPGLVDLNVSLNIDGASIVTSQAISGGVTTIVTSDNVVGDLYSDVAKVSVLTNENLSNLKNSPDLNLFAYKAFLVPQGPNSAVLSNVEQALTAANLPVFVHPELVSQEKLHQATPFRLVEPEKRIYSGKIVVYEEKNIKASKFCLNSSDEENDFNDSESCSDENVPDITINDFTIEEKNDLNEMISDFDNMRLKVPEKDKKRVSLPNLLGSDKLIVPIKNSPRHNSVQCLGLNRPIPIQDIPFISKGIIVEQAYQDHISNFPID